MPAVRGEAAVKLVSAVYDSTADGTASQATVLDEAGTGVAHTGVSNHPHDLRPWCRSVTSSRVVSDGSCVTPAEKCFYRDLLHHKTCVVSDDTAYI